MSCGGSGNANQSMLVTHERVSDGDAFLVGCFLMGCIAALK